MSYPYLIQGANITVVIDNKPYTISKTHITYNKVLEAIKAGDWEAVKDAIEPKKIFYKFSNGVVKIEDGQFFWKGQLMHNALTTRMIEMLKEDFPIDPLINFMSNLMSNPSKRAVDELYGFLEKNNLPITPDGHFLAYKRVRNDYKDCHSGTMDNSVGSIVEMERNQVDDDKDRTCSAGLHFCSHEYLKSFGGERTVILKINPRDVVSIPSDYNDSKGRCCRYEVIGEVEHTPDESVEFNKPVQSNANSVKVKGPKEGTSDFYRGYTDGYKNNDYIGGNYPDYDDGYNKGDQDALDGVPERYRYVGE